MNKHVLAVVLTALLHCAFALAQTQEGMTFTFAGGATAKTSTRADGTVVYTLPSNVSLSPGECITGVSVNGVSVEPTDIVPNPTATLITEGEIETFVYDNKAYSFRFMYDEWFTVVMFTDVHIDESREGFTSAEFSTFVDDVIKMGKDGGKTFAFDNAPTGFIPTADLVMCLGDMDQDNQSSSSNGYVTATAKFYTNGIPFVDMVGNHDLVPDHWGGENGEYGLTIGGSNNNNIALKIVTNHLDNAKKKGISDVTRFTDGNSNHTQAQPYAFLFNGIRFYVGQTYWFQKPYSGSYLSGTSALTKATYYKPDGVISALDTYVESHKDEPSIWAQHYPFAFGSDCDRWWLDQNDVGKTILPTDNGSSAYPGTTTKYGTGDAVAAANTRKDALSNIIKKTKNAVHFSGHTHEYAKNTYNGVDDYSLKADARYKGVAYIVLCKKGEGFKEIKEVTFSYQ